MNISKILIHLILAMLWLAFGIAVCVFVSLYLLFMLDILIAVPIIIMMVIGVIWVAVKIYTDGFVSDDENKEKDKYSYGKV